MFHLIKDECQLVTFISLVIISLHVTSHQPSSWPIPGTRDNVTYVIRSSYPYIMAYNNVKWLINPGVIFWITCTGHTSTPEYAQQSFFISYALWLGDQNSFLHLYLSIPAHSMYIFTVACWLYKKKFKLIYALDMWISFDNDTNSSYSDDLVYWLDAADELL